MATKRNKAIAILKNLVNDLEKEFKISDAYLFGSYATGLPGKWSDIDLALVSPQFKGIRFLDFKKLLPHLRGYPNSLEIHPFKKEDFTSDNLFAKKIVKTGIKIK